MIKNVSDIFPIAGGTAGAIDAITKAINNSDPVSFKAIFIYIGLTILGASIGYLVKAILDMFDIQKRIKNLKNQLKIFDKKK